MFSDGNESDWVEEDDTGTKKTKSKHASKRKGKSAATPKKGNCKRSTKSGRTARDDPTVGVEGTKNFY